MTFSLRTRWELRANALTARREALERSGEALLDLSESNPTRVGFSAPDDVLAALSSKPATEYSPEPRGLLTARASVSAYFESNGAQVTPESLLLTASTSEAYAFLFKLLCDPGDEILVPEPSYPLFSYLTTLESVSAQPYPLHYANGWRLDVSELERAASERTRAVIVVNPGNPTGHFLKRGEWEALDSLCVRRGWALLSDEVFTPFGYAADEDRVSCVAGEDCGALSFSLSGLSKLCGLPQLKVGWLAASGPDSEVGEALKRLEVIADTFLSVSTPSQLAVGAALSHAPEFQARVLERLRENRAALKAKRTGSSPWSLLQSEGGWNAVLQLPAATDEEQLCLRLLDVGLIAQPGFFFDFPKGKHLVVSLLLEPRVFAEGLKALVPLLDALG